MRKLGFAKGYNLKRKLGLIDCESWWMVIV